MTSHDWVLDTNVLISAVLSRQGSPCVLVQRVLAEARSCFPSPRLKSCVAGSTAPSSTATSAWICESACCATSQPAPPGWKLITKGGWSCDPDDDKFIATAL